MLKSFLLILFIGFCNVHPAFGQESLPKVNEIVKKAAAQQVIYIETFKNLIAEETKTIELYDKTETLTRQQKIVSTFIVYELSKKAGQIAEFRNVTSVDGKRVKNAEKRAQKFFEKIVKAEDSVKELEKLSDESLRYDLFLRLNGFTVANAYVLSSNLVDYFDFQIIRKENFEGNDVYIISFKQARESPDIKIKSSKDIKVNDKLNGLLWIDAKTFQVWREERERTIQPEMFESPVVASKEIYEYQKSDFGILTPKKIIYTQYSVNLLEKKAVKNAEFTLEYSKFSKPETEIESADIK